MSCFADLNNSHTFSVKYLSCVADRGRARFLSMSGDLILTRATNLSSYLKSSPTHGSHDERIVNARTQQRAHYTHRKWNVFEAGGRSAYVLSGYIRIILLACAMHMCVCVCVVSHVYERGKPMSLWEHICICVHVYMWMRICVCVALWESPQLSYSFRAHHPPRPAAYIYACTNDFWSKGWNK